MLINGPDDIQFKRDKHFDETKKFWDSLPFREDEKLEAYKDELWFMFAFDRYSSAFSNETSIWYEVLVQTQNTQQIFIVLLQQMFSEATPEEETIP